MWVFAWIVFVWVVLGAVYVYGVHVGLREGAKRGRSASDAEWSLFLEHGAA